MYFSLFSRHLSFADENILINVASRVLYKARTAQWLRGRGSIPGKSNNFASRHHAETGLSKRREGNVSVELIGFRIYGVLSACPHTSSWRTYLPLMCDTYTAYISAVTTTATRTFNDEFLQGLSCAHFGLRSETTANLPSAWTRAWLDGHLALPSNTTVWRRNVCSEVRRLISAYIQLPHCIRSLWTLSMLPQSLHALHIV
jgi:hypothetical protein